MAVIVEGAGRRCFLGVKAAAGWHRWNEMEVEATPDGVRLKLALEGRTDSLAAAAHIDALLLEREAECSYQELLREGLQRQYPANADARIPDWWLRPIYCGWGDQVAFAMHAEGVGPERRALNYCIQGLYERWIGKLEAAGMPIGTITIDAGWSPTGVWEADPIRWPDLRGFIRRQHAAGRRVLLWVATWLWDGLPPELCILADGRRLAADPSNPRYLDKLQQWIGELLGPDGLDADGFKIDQLGFSPRMTSNRFGPRFGYTVQSDEPVREVQMHGDLWGIELLHAYQKAIYTAAKAVKPDCLITSSTVHPYFRGTFDMVRLHDMGLVAPDIMVAMKIRSDLSRAVFPDFPIDADDWVHENYQTWLDYTCSSHQLGVPCTLYTEHFVSNWATEPATRPIRDLHRIAAAWKKAGYHGDYPPIGGERTPVSQENASAFNYQSL